MTVSFVLPAYKRAFLKEAISSILAQTRRDFELVVVDDASPENLNEIVDGFSDSRLSYFCNSGNIGGENLVAAWNKALEYAHGEWCVLASDDDVYAPTFLEEMVRLAERHPDVDLVRSRVKIIDGKGSVVGLSPANPEVESAIGLMYDRAARAVDTFVPEFMFRRARLDEIGGFVPFPKAWYSDEATWALMAENGCANSNIPLFSFRFSGINISTSYDRVSDLVDAGCRYYEWAKSYLRRARPKDDVERWLLRETEKHLENRVLGLIYAELDKTAVGERLRVLRGVPMPGGWKRRCILHALKRLVAR